MAIGEGYGYSFEKAKACAIICVDEILNTHAFKAASGHKTFWLNVKDALISKPFMEKQTP